MSEDLGPPDAGESNEPPVAARAAVNTLTPANLSANFKRSEFACKCGCGGDTADAVTVRILQEVRDHYGVPVTINSGFRCASHNKKVGGASNSQHLTGRAADIVVKGVAPSAVYAWLNSGPMNGWGGLGKYNGFTHVDTRSGPPARW